MRKACPNPHDLDAPEKIHELRALIKNKRSLQLYYLEIYQKYKECVSHCPTNGMILELGSGAGFIKEVIPEAVTSDILPYAGVDQVVDATQLPFADHSIRAILMSNVFHHLPDVEAFLREASRCLMPGGRIFIADQYKGWFSSFIFRYLHHENFDVKTPEWKFQSTGPLSSANGALAWIVFSRDLARFESISALKLIRFQAHSPLRYWWMGGLKKWSLLPAWAFPLASWIDRLLIKLSQEFASFVDIELVK